MGVIGLTCCVIKDGGIFNETLMYHTFTKGDEKT